MAKLVIHLGHSNCQGFADMNTLQAEYESTFTNIKAWGGSSFASLDYLVNNNQYPVSHRNTKFGIEFALLTLLQTTWNEDVYYFKYGIGGTKVAADGAGTDWNVANKGEYAYVSMSELNKVLAYMWNTLGITDYEIYIVIHHGENDAVVEADSLAFTTNLTALINFILDNLSGTAFTNSIKFIGLGQNNNNQGQTYSNNVLISYPDVVANFPTRPIARFATNSYPLGSGSHYNAAGYKSFGEAIANYIINNNL